MTEALLRFADPLVMRFLGYYGALSLPAELFDETFARLRERMVAAQPVSGVFAAISLAEALPASWHALLSKLAKKHAPKNRAKAAGSG